MLGCTAVLGAYILQHTFGDEDRIPCLSQQANSHRPLAQLWQSTWKPSNISECFGTANESAFPARDITCVFIPTTKPTTWCNIGIMKLHSFLELTCSHLCIMLFDLGRDWNAIGCLCTR